MHETASVLFTLFVMFAVAKIGGEIFERLRQPVVIGELLAGIVLGIFAFVGDSEIYRVIAEIGAILLLFHVGLETRASSIFKVGGHATAVAILGVILPFVLGFGLMLILGYDSAISIFVGTALVATSVGITARVLSDMGLIKTIEAKVILGAAVIDDILAMILVAVVSGITTGEVSPGGLALLIAEVAIFLLFVSLIGTRVVRQYGSVLEHLNIRNAPLVVSIIVLLGLSALSAYIGLAAIIGAFLAGMMFAETKDQYALEHKIEPLYDFLVPFFFVLMGALVDVSSFASGSVLLLAIGITLLAILGKLVGCALGSYRLGGLSAAIVGVGMVPRGEVGIVIALLGLNLGVINGELYGAIIFMVVVTTLIVPPVLKWLYSIHYKGKTLTAATGRVKRG